jgi:hypothetical protein
MPSAGSGALSICWRLPTRSWRCPRGYEALKRALAERCDASDAAAREAYAAAKTDFVTDIVRRALAEGYPRATA